MSIFMLKECIKVRICTIENLRIELMFYIECFRKDGMLSTVDKNSIF